MAGRFTPAASRGVVRALVIDEKVEDVMRLRKLLLTTGGFHVHGVRGFDEARDLLGRSLFDVALIDYELWRDGAECFIRLLRDVGSDIAVVLLTNAGVDRESLHALRLGGQDFFSKDTLDDGEHLAARISVAVGERRSLRRRDTRLRWLEREARTDHLTGLENRRAFDDQLSAVCQGTQRNRQPISLVLADIAETRSVNEAYGHQAGDRMIRTAAGVIARSLRGGDFAARIGGDEFGIILVNADEELALRITRRIAQQLDRGNQEDSAAPAVTMSFAVVTAVGASAEALFNAAEQQLSTNQSARVPVRLVRRSSGHDGPHVA